MPSRNKQIRDRVNTMNNGWKQGAPDAVFAGISQPAFQADIEAAAAEEQEIANLEAQIQLKKTSVEARYKKLNEDSIKVRDGVEGHEDFGSDHPLVEAMGFVRSSERRSGLTRKKNSPPSP